MHAAHCSPEPLLLLLLPEDVLLELVSESELLLLLLRLCFFLRAFLRASASCFCFSSSSFLLYRIQSGTSSGFRYLRLACRSQVHHSPGTATTAMKQQGSGMLPYVMC